MPCIFCEIAAHTAPAYVLYEDDLVMAFLDREPISKGHALIIPKEDVKDIHELNSKTGARLLEIAKMIAGILESEFSFDGSMIMEVNGVFQEVPHLHLHVFGRNKDNDINFKYPKDTSDTKDLKKIASLLAPRLQELPLIKIKASKKHGKGVFALQEIKSGETILVVDDSNIIKDLNKVPKKDRDHIDSYDGKDVLWIGSEKYINHSCEPNVYLKTENGTRKVIAMKPIKKNAELVFDYRIGGYGNFQWECNCKTESCSKNCDIDFFKLPEEKQQDYLPYLDGWFVKMFKKEVNHLKFKRMQHAIKSLSSDLMDSYTSFFIYDTLRTLRAPNKVKMKVAKENVETMKRYSTFFTQSERAHFLNFLLVLARFFDDSKQSLSLIKTKNWALTDLRSLDADAFREANKGRFAVESLADAYEGLKSKDLEEIDEDLLKHNKYIEKLLEIRNKAIAHKDIKRHLVKGVAIKEMTLLFELVERIVNKLSYKLDHSSFSFGHAQENAKRDTELVLDHLKRFEPYKLREIKEKYKKTLGDSKK